MLSHHFISAAALMPPPYIGVPALTDDILGWLVGFVLLVGPSVLLALRSHRILGHWSRYFAHWRRLGWWMTVLGSAALASGVFTFITAIPLWEQRWSSWYQHSLQNDTADMTPLGWLNMAQGQLDQAFRVAAIALAAIGLIVLVAGFRRFLRTVLIKRQPVAPKPTWMMTPDVSA